MIAKLFKKISRTIEKNAQRRKKHQLQPIRLKTIKESLNSKAKSKSSAQAGSDEQKRSAVSKQ